MSTSGTNARILVYSHDTFGLGHLRRCRTIAQSLVARRKGLSVLILSGSPIIGSFEFPTRVDFVRIPGVIKLRNGEYSSLSLHMDISEVLRLRAGIIRYTAEAFAPDIFLVDKEPLGLRGEIQDTLLDLKARNVRLVLGLRDVMDDSKLLAREWRRKNPLPALRDLYDDIFVYGLPEICNPLQGIDLPQAVFDKITYTGYLRSRVSAGNPPASWSQLFDEPYVLVTTGGGGDGADLVDWVLSAYEADADIPLPALIVFGPFMSPRRRQKFRARVDRLPRVEAITFDARVEHLMAKAAGVVAMGGYNTFCDILTLDKRAIIVPRRRPRLEQHIRASRAEMLGVVRMLSDKTDRDPLRMAAALRELPAQRRPSATMVPGMLDGLDRIDARMTEWLSQPGRDSLGLTVNG